MVWIERGRGKRKPRRDCKDRHSRLPISASRMRIDSVEEFYLVFAIGGRHRDGDGEADGSGASPSPAAAFAVRGQEGRKGRMEGQRLDRRDKAAAGVCFIRPRPPSHCAIGSPSRCVPWSAPRATPRSGTRRWIPCLRSFWVVVSMEFSVFPLYWVSCADETYKIFSWKDPSISSSISPLLFPLT